MHERRLCQKTHRPTAVRLQKTTISSEDAILSAQEEPGPPAEIPGPPADQMTPPSGLGLPTPPSAAKERESRPASLNLEVQRVTASSQHLI